MVRHTLKSLGPKVLASRMVSDYVHQLYAPAALSAARMAADDFAAARQLAAWRNAVLAAWPGVSVLHVDSQLAGESQLGAVLTLRAEVALNGLSPDDVDVEAVFGGVDMDDSLTDFRTVSLKSVDVTDGTSRYEGDVPLERTGAFGYTVRVLPKSELLASPAELGLVATA
jgi:glycogen phosphorylase